MSTTKRPALFGDEFSRPQRKHFYSHDFMLRYGGKDTEYETYILTQDCAGTVVVSAKTGSADLVDGCQERESQ